MFSAPARLCARRESARGTSGRAAKMISSSEQARAFGYPSLFVVQSYVFIFVVPYLVVIPSYATITFMEATSMDLGHRKGQGATEYLVLLAVVLIVAMVAIALLGFFPGLAGDAKKAQSDAYWRGEARPFAIIEHAQAPTSNLTLVMQNLDSDQRILTNISVAGGPINGSYVPNATQAYFSAGEKRTIIMPISLGGTAIDATNNGCTSGNTYEYSINFTYSNADQSITGQKEYGTKTLVGKCQ